ncbi:MAG TPA: Ig-like domain-containing protein, partial [Bryobacteraceae bacterium]|nr:Ig-like domain-containing protein [Bryobacteraceae bacterium]
MAGLFVSRFLTLSGRTLGLLSLASAALYAQTLTISSGNGQLIPEQSLSNQPFVIVAKDAAGHPASNVAITWTLTKGKGTLISPSLSTDANGQASAGFVSTSLFGSSFESETVTATSSFGAVNFFITTYYSAAGQSPFIQFIAPTQDNPKITAPAGSTVPGAAIARVIA